MTTRPEIVFAPLSADLEPSVLVLAGEDAALGPRAREIDQRAGGVVLKAIEAAQFKGRKKSTLEVLAPPRLGSVNRIIVLGTGKTGELKENDWVLLGGSAAAGIGARKAKSASLIAEAADNGGTKPELIAALLAFGAALRQYEFRKYLTKKPSEEEGSEQDGLQKLVVHCVDPDKARGTYQRYEAVANGTVTARDLVNEPANALGPVEFADRVKELESAGLEIEILDEEQLGEMKMGALLAVAQGSVRPARVAVLQWHGAKSKRAKPLALVGKGVVFDTGGISIKPAAGMEDMKGDMGGAAAVVGVMQALAERKANVNVIGIIGLVENMPSGTAIRPGDIVRAHSGQTVEILNTDAEGRLVLVDLISYIQERFKPRLIIDLATLTGAIMVALGKEYAGSSSTTRSWRATSSRPPPRRARSCGACRSTRPTTRCSNPRTPTSRTSAGAGPARARPPPSSSTSSRTRRGRTSTSPARPWTRPSRRSTRVGARAGACGCSTASSPTTTRGRKSRRPAAGRAAPL